VLLVLGFQVFLSVHAETSWSLNAEVSGLYDSNVGKAQRLRDTVEDESVSVDGRYQFNWEPNMESLWAFSGSVNLTQFDTVTALNETSFGAEIAYSWQNGFGYSVPFYRVAISYQSINVDSDGRSSQKLKFQGFVTKRLLTDLTGRLGLEMTSVSADDAVFDNEEVRAFANVDYFWSQRLVNYYTFSVIQGSINSVAQAQFCNGLIADDIYPVIRESSHISRDDAFNQHFCGDWFSYRLDATTMTLAAGLNYALSHKYSIDVSVTAVNSEVSEDVDYQRLLARASVLVRF
jgi:hypothetical protein